MSKEATATVKRVGQINFVGNIIPHTWYQFLRRGSVDELTGEIKQGKPHTIAIILLSEIAYWYRPRIIRDEQTGQVIRIEKRFAADLLQRTYMSFANQFGFTKRQVQAALKYLELKKIITLELRTITTKTGLVLNNVLFIDLDADSLARITIPNQPDIPPKVSPITNKCNTYDAPSHTCTEITTEITEEESQHQPSTVDVAPAVPDDTIPFSEPPIQEIDMAGGETSQGKKPKVPIGERRRWFAVLAKVCQMDMDLNRGRLNSEVVLFCEGSFAIADVKRLYGPGQTWWYTQDFRGKQGTPPRPEWIRQTLKQAMGGNKSTVRDPSMIGWVSWD